MKQKKTVNIFRRNLGYPAFNKTADENTVLHSSSEYNQQGLLLEQKVFDADGNLFEYVLNAYNENGFLVSEKYIAGDVETTEEKSYQRNENGLILSEFKHYADGSIDTTKYEYDSQFRIISMHTFDEEGDLETKEVFEYQGEYLKKKEVYDNLDNLLLREEIKVDEQGNTREVIRWDDESDETTRAIFLYNNAGLKVEEQKFDEEGTLVDHIKFIEDESGRVMSIVEQGQTKETRTHFQYDEQGNQILQVVVNAENKEIVRVERKFNEDNEMIYSNVFVDGEGRSLNQHYEVVVEYTYF